MVLNSSTCTGRCTCSMGVWPWQAGQLGWLSRAGVGSRHSHMLCVGAAAVPAVPCCALKHSKAAALTLCPPALSFTSMRSSSSSLPHSRTSAGRLCGGSAASLPSGCSRLHAWQAGGQAGGGWQPEAGRRHLPLHLPQRRPRHEPGPAPSWASPDERVVADVPHLHQHIVDALEPAPARALHLPLHQPEQGLLVGAGQHCGRQPGNRKAGRC